MNKIGKLISVLYRSPTPESVYAYSPGVCVLPSGRIVATMDLGGPGVAELDGVKGTIGKIQVKGKIFISDDGGESWRFITDTPMMHARPFVAGSSVYVLGHEQDLTIVRSDDDGESWTAPARLTEGQYWHQAPCNVLYSNGNVYLVMERNLEPTATLWPVATLVPVLMRGSCEDDLTKRENWMFASEMCCRDTLDIQKLGYFAISELLLY